MVDETICVFLRRIEIKEGFLRIPPLHPEDDCIRNFEPFLYSCSHQPFVIVSECLRLAQRTPWLCAVDQMQLKVAEFSVYFAPSVFAVHRNSCVDVMILPLLPSKRSGVLVLLVLNRKRLTATSALAFMPNSHIMCDDYAPRLACTSESIRKQGSRTRFLLFPHQILNAIL